MTAFFSCNNFVSDGIYICLCIFATVPVPYRYMKSGSSDNLHSLIFFAGEVYMKVGQMEEAERWYKEALKAKSDHVPAHLTMAKLLHKKVNRHSSRTPCHFVK